MTGRLFALVFVFCLPALFGAVDQGVSYMRSFIPGEEEASYGLGKLSPAERARFEELFRTMLERLDMRMEKSALAYLRTQGWAEVEVTGAESATLVSELGEEQFVAVLAAGKKYLLEPVTPPSFVPGRFLGRVEDKSFAVIGLDGSVARYVVRKATSQGE